MGGETRGGLWWGDRRKEKQERINPEARRGNGELKAERATI